VAPEGAAAEHQGDRLEEQIGAAGDALGGIFEGVGVGEEAGVVITRLWIEREPVAADRVLEVGTGAVKAGEAEGEAELAGGGAVRIEGGAGGVDEVERQAR
jgi:hypothetical protein